MIWILSFGLCLFLLLGVVLMFFPELVSPVLANRWTRDHRYWHRGD